VAAVGVFALGLGWELGDYIPGGRNPTVRPVTALATTTSSLGVAEPGLATGGTASITGGTASKVTATTALPRTTTSTASSARVSDPTLLRVVCDAVALEVVGQVLTPSEAGDAVREYQAAPDPASGFDAFCRSWVRDHLPTDPGRSGTPNIVSSTN
jgi:hypothetical protein